MTSLLDKRGIGFLLAVLALAACLVGITTIGRHRQTPDQSEPEHELAVVELEETSPSPNVENVLPVSPSPPGHVAAPMTSPPVEPERARPDGEREQPPHDIAALVGAARGAIIENEFEVAGDAFAAALRLSADLPVDSGEARWLRDELSDAYWQKYDYGGPGAEKTCREMVEAVLAAEIGERPAHPFARELLMEYLRRSHRRERLIDLFGPDDMPIDKSDANDLALYGHAMVRAQRGAEVLPELLRAYRRNRNSWKLTYAIGLAHKQTGERVQARIKLKQALLHCPDEDSRSVVRNALEGL